MALTLRTNGSASQNLITSSWWNDYYNLLTGNMSDQPVQINNSLTLKYTLGQPAAPTCTPVAGTGMGVGSYTYGYTWVNAFGGESYGSVNSSATTTSPNANVTVSAVTTGPAGTVARNVYRSKVGTSSPLYYLRTISDNTTTSFTDSTADASLTTQFSPSDASWGGLIFKDSVGNVEGFIAGNLGGTFTGSQRLGYVAAPGGKHAFQAPAGTDILYIANSGVTVNTGGLTVNPGIITFPAGNGNSFPFTLKTGVVPYVTCGNSGFGIKNAGNTALLELKVSGNLVIAGAYQTTAGTFTTAAGQSFDSFDYAEIYECDQSYPNGTVVCPGPNDKMTRCTHDNCYAASVISYNPGFQAGQEKHEAGIHPIALVGRVNVRTAVDIAFRNMVVADGRGGVRPLKSGEWGYSLGFALNDALNGKVGIMLRPTLARGI